MSPGEVLVVGLEGTELRDAERAMLRDLRPAGVIVFRRNVAALAQLVRLLEEVEAELVRPLLLVDQEGGRVDRLKPLIGPSPSARRLCAAGCETVREHAELTARALRACGLNFNCAPVVDLDEGHEGNGIADRSFGREPEAVALAAAEVLAAHAQAGLLACLKHFPGLGRTRADTHELRPSSPLDLAELEERELRPFRALAGAAPAVMVSHASFPEAAGEALPASLSRPVVEGLLRTRLGFEGLILTDDLEMGAVTDRRAGERAVAAVEAGCDLLLLCKESSEAREAHAALDRRADCDAGFAARLQRAGERVQGARRLHGGLAAGAGDEGEIRLVGEALRALCRRLEHSVL